MEPFGKCSSFLLLMTSMPHFSIPGIPRRIPSVSFATTAVDLDRVSHVFGVQFDLSYYGHVSLSIALCGGSYVRWL